MVQKNHNKNGPNKNGLMDLKKSLNFLYFSAEFLQVISLIAPGFLNLLSSPDLINNNLFSDLVL